METPWFFTTNLRSAWENLIDPTAHVLTTNQPWPAIGRAVLHNKHSPITDDKHSQRSTKTQDFYKELSSILQSPALEVNLPRLTWVLELISRGWGTPGAVLPYVLAALAAMLQARSL